MAFRTIFEIFSPEEQVFENSLLWKNPLLRIYTTCQWEGQGVSVWGGQADSASAHRDTAIGL